MVFPQAAGILFLVGKDGGVKRQYTTPVRATTIFEQIDAM
ncbi:MAG: DUF4174 domain-containing protein, partial [Nostoc sp.]